MEIWNETMALLNIKVNVDQTYRSERNASKIKDDATPVLTPAVRFVRFGKKKEDGRQVDDGIKFQVNGQAAVSDCSE